MEKAHMARKVFVANSIIIMAGLVLSACASLAPAVSSAETKAYAPTVLKQIIETNTPEPVASATESAIATATATPTALPTEIKLSLPERWDDPALLEKVKTDFEGKTGITVEDAVMDAQHKGLLDQVSYGGLFGGLHDWNMSFRVVVIGSAPVQIDEDVVVEVMYGGMPNGSEVRIMPFSIGIYDNDNQLQSVPAYTLIKSPGNYVEIDEPVTKELVDEQLISQVVETAIVIRFDNVENCGDFTGHYYQAKQKYLSLFRKQCEPGGYIRVLTEDQSLLGSKTPLGGEYVNDIGIIFDNFSDVLPGGFPLFALAIIE